MNVRQLAALLALVVATAAQAAAGPSAPAFNSGTGFTAPGAPTKRSVAQRAADTVNVKDWGAKGDGSNDTPAIAAAYAALGSAGGTIVFPPGEYRFNLVVNQGGVYLVGAGDGYSSAKSTRFIAQDPTLPIVQWGDGTAIVQSGGMRLVNLVGHGAAFGQNDGLVVKGARNLTFGDFSALLFGRHGIRVTSSAAQYTTRIRFENIALGTNHVASLRVDSDPAPATFTTAVFFTNLYASDTTTAASRVISIDGTGAAFPPFVDIANGWIDCQDGHGVLLSGGAKIFGSNLHIDGDLAGPTIVEITTASVRRISDAVLGDVTIDGKVLLPSGLTAVVSAVTHQSLGARLQNPYLNDYLGFGDQGAAGEPEAAGVPSQVTLFRKGANGSGFETVQLHGAAYRPEMTWTRPLQTGAVNPASSVGATGGALWRNATTGGLHYKLNSIWPSTDGDGAPVATVVAPPATATSACKVGDHVGDATHLYTCINTNLWRRVPHAGW